MGGGAVKRCRVIKIVVALLVSLLLLLASQLVLGTGLVNLLKRSLPTLTPLEIRFQESFITAEDLPLGWHRGRMGIRTEEVAGAEARFLVFYGTWDPDKTWVNVGQEIVLYPDPETAASAYEKRLADYTESWSTPSSLDFDSHADQVQVLCFKGATIDGVYHQSCDAVGLYGDLLVILGANVFEDRWLTMEDFRAVLEAMDRQIVATAEKAGQ
jgi:hypothetical protein